MAVAFGRSIPQPRWAAADLQFKRILESQSNQCGIGKGQLRNVWEYNNFSLNKKGPKRRALTRRLTLFLIQLADPVRGVADVPEDLRLNDLFPLL